MAPWRRLSPLDKTLRKSCEFCKDSRSGSETLSALLATRLEGGAASAGVHSMAKTMTAFSTTNFRLVSPLHNKFRVGGSGTSTKGETTEYGRRESYVKARIRQNGSMSGLAREEFVQVAKRTRHGFGRSQPVPSPSTIWKNKLPPGFLLWKEDLQVFHIDDSRGLDLLFRSLDTRLTQNLERADFPCPCWTPTPHLVANRDLIGKRCTQSFPQMWTDLWTTWPWRGMAFDSGTKHN